MRTESSSSRTASGARSGGLLLDGNMHNVGSGIKVIEGEEVTALNTIGGEARG